MKTDPELETWQSLWQADAQLPHDLRERAMRQVRRMRIMLAGDIAVTMIMGGGAVVWALNSDGPAVRLLVVWIWFTLLVAWIFRYLNNRGNWTGAAPSTDAFFEAWIRRCRATQRNLIFGIGLGAVQFAVCSAWVNRELHRMHGITVLQFATMAPMDVAYVCAAGLLAWALWLSRKVRAEWIYAQRLRDEWAIGEPIPVLSPGVLSPVRKKRFLESITLFSDSLDWQLRRKKKRVWKL
ncbi:MAG TPA: hypothetical protein VG168_01765 [Bryobacteraceae bacterium]|nr:hypothetical protein [Bryobacteraceae bacterium]